MLPRSTRAVINLGGSGWCLRTQPAVRSRRPPRRSATRASGIFDNYVARTMLYPDVTNGARLEYLSQKQHRPTAPVYFLPIEIVPPDPEGFMSSGRCA